MCNDVENINIWHEVTEETKKIMITNEEPESKSIRSFKVFGYLEESDNLRVDKYGYLKNGIERVKIIEPPECVIINLIDYSGLKLDNLEGMTQNLPHLESLLIFCQNLTCLTGLPKYLPELKSLGICFTNIETLKGLPKSLPKLKRFRIFDTKIESLEYLPPELPSLGFLNIDESPLKSLQYLPKSLPKLEQISINNTDIVNVVFFPNDVPVLKIIKITENNNLISLNGLPSNIPMLGQIYLFDNQLSSLEQLPSNFKEKHRESIVVDIHNDLWVRGNPIRTLTGIKNNYLLKIIIETAYKIRGFQLSPAAKKLIDDYNEKKIREDVLTVDENTGNVVNFRMRKNPALFYSIIKYYQKTPMELAQQLIEDPNSLSDDEFDRLGWEGGYKERQLLEPHLSLDHPILWEISQRLTHELPSGLSILK